MDYRELYAGYARQTKADEATPKQLFQLVVFGFMNGAYSTRQLETACRNDIRYMYILGGKRAPDHNRFWSFIQKRLQGGVAEGLFYQLVKELGARGEISYERLFADGTKIEANANRYSFVWAKSVSKYEVKLDEKLAELLKRLSEEYALGGAVATAEEAVTALQKERAARNISFVHGRGKRKSQLQRDTELLESYLARKAKYRDYNATFKGRNSFSKTDRDATFMRMKEDHMRNGQLKPGYNLQLGVEGEYIVGVDISSERSDQNTLLSLLDRMEAGCGKRHACVVADAGYESEENYLGVQQRGQTAYIKPQNYEKSKTRKYRTNACLRENMPYDAQADSYTCPAGKTFEPVYETKRKSKTGYEATISVYECFACQGCPQKKLCTRAKGNRRLQVSKQFISLRQIALERITSPEGKMLRLNRSIQSEGAFGVLKQDYGFRRFLRRGAQNVFTETLLYAMAYNIDKLKNKLKANKSGCTLHLLSSA
jgi:transposase